jgi:hypothetical protein
MVEVAVVLMVAHSLNHQAKMDTEVLGVDSVQAEVEMVNLFAILQVKI